MISDRIGVSQNDIVIISVYVGCGILVCLLHALNGCCFDLFVTGIFAFICRQYSERCSLSNNLCTETNASFVVLVYLVHWLYYVLLFFIPL